jgi:hypothetical protein
VTGILVGKRNQDYSAIQLFKCTRFRGKSGGFAVNLRVVNGFSTKIERPQGVLQACAFNEYWLYLQQILSDVCGMADESGKLVLGKLLKR